MHTLAAPADGEMHARPGPQPLPPVAASTVQGSSSIEAPDGTHAATSRPAPSSSIDAHALPDAHDDGDAKTSHTAAHPAWPLVSWRQALLAPQSASFVHSHCPVEPHAPLMHVPHEPPHPSSPQTRASHDDVHVAAQVPLLPLHTSPLGQVPHEPPQPSLPQLLPEHFGVHVGFGIVGEDVEASPGSVALPSSVESPGGALVVVVVEQAAKKAETPSVKATAAERRKGMANP
jgi:hypothetical protein